MLPVDERYDALNEWLRGHVQASKRQLTPPEALRRVEEEQVHELNSAFLAGRQTLSKQRYYRVLGGASLAVLISAER